MNLNFASLLLATPLLAGTLSAATVVNVDFSRDISGLNPGTNQADILASIVGIAPDTGTVWNDYSVVMTNNVISATGAVPPGDSRSNLLDSTGAATTIDITLTSGFFRAFNPAATTSYNNVSREWIFGSEGATGVITVTGLELNATYDFYLLVGNTFGSTFSIGANSESVSGIATPTANPAFADWTEGVEYAKITGTADGLGNLVISVGDNSAATNGGGSISGMQIVAIPEASSSLLLLGSLLGLGLRRRR
jgi:hypothetical protein